MINILYEDSEIIICEKEPGLLSEFSDNSPISLPKLLSDQISTAPLFTVHRLDKEVGGIMVYAKNSSSAADLSSQISNGTFEKQYIAMVSGRLSSQCGCLKDLLFHDKQKNKTYIAKKKRMGVKEALLNYEEILYDSEQNTSVLKIELLTGRTHQIRVQFASRQCPILGDRKYGSSLNLKPIRLYSHKLSFLHPRTKQAITVSSLPFWFDNYPKDTEL